MAPQWASMVQAGLLTAVLLLLIPALVWCAEILLALVPPAASRREPSEVRPRLAVLMPAHDEASTIVATLAALRPQLARADRLLVVADNCRDETAALARAQGAEVMERFDREQRGKGFALAEGMRALAEDPPEIVLIVDADCQVHPGAIERLASRCARSGRAQQALYLMHSPAGAGPLRRLAEFAWLVRNQVRPLGLHRLGGPCQLMGSGMAFPWQALARAELATGHIVEDLKLGIELAAAGSAPLFCPEALVTSEFPATSEGVASQRRRWEHGHLSLLFSAAPRLLLRSLARRDPNALALALDLAVPPLALQVLLSGTLWVASALLAWRTGLWAALACASALLAAVAGALLLAWLRFGRRVVSLATLAWAGVYALAKLPLYLRFLHARQGSWVRSARGGAQAQAEQAKAPR